MTGPCHPGVSLLVLAKHSQDAKSRLRLPAYQARQLALDLAASTVRVALAAETVDIVLVVTSDECIAQDALASGARVVTEPRGLGMNRAADLGRRRALELRPHAPVAVVVADLPRLRPTDLDEVVRDHRAGGSPLYVVDDVGTGTTFVIHGAHQRPGFGFGRDSALMHERLGYRCAASSSRSLRWDLDTPEDLEALAPYLTWGAATA